MSEDRKMQAGDDPADFTVEEVADYPATVTDDTERSRVLGAESEENGGKGRVGILQGTHNAPTPDDPDGGVYDEAVDREDTTSAFIIPNHNTIPQSVQDEDAAKRNSELEEAGVNQSQGFIGSDGNANLLG